MDEASPESIAEARQKVQDHLDLILHLFKKQNYMGHDANLIPGFRLVSAHPSGQVVLELDIGPEYGNLNGVMHGGAAGVIFDMGTTAAQPPIQSPGYWDFMGGVTRNLNITYLKAVPIGTTVRIKAQVVSHGRRLSLIRGTMESVDGKIVYAKVEHQKVMAPTRPEHLSVREELRKAKLEKNKKEAKL